MAYRGSSWFVFKHREWYMIMAPLWGVHVIDSDSFKSITIFTSRANFEYLALTFLVMIKENWIKVGYSMAGCHLGCWNFLRHFHYCIFLKVYFRLIEVDVENTLISILVRRSFEQNHALILRSFSWKNVLEVWDFAWLGLTRSVPNHFNGSDTYSTSMVDTN